MAMTDPLAHLGQRFGGRDFFFTGLRAEAPKIQQRFNRQIVGAFALIATAVRRPGPFEYRCRHGLTAMAGKR
jgi:hypothetical protein